MAGTEGDAAARAIALFLLGGVFFVSLNSIAKALAPDLGPVMVIWGRFFFHVALAALLFPRAVPRLSTPLRTPAPER